jgi:threonyl-tRNA synthetase
MQVMVTTITSDADGYAREVLAALKALGLRADIDLRNEKINYKVREHSVQKVPVILALGKREVEERTVSMRRLGSKGQRVSSLSAVLDELQAEAKPPAPGSARPGAG